MGLSAWSSTVQAAQNEAEARTDYATDKLAWLRRCKIPHPVRGLIDFDPYGYQEALVLDESRLRLILKSRQTGISQTIALEALHDALYNPAATMLIVSKDKESAQNVLSYVRTALEEGCPTPPGLTVVTNSKSQIEFSNRSKIRCIAATKSAGRSVSASHIYMDEAAFPIWAAQIYRSAKPTISTGGRMTILSTPDGRANLFYLLWNGDIGTGYSKHRIHWSSCPAYFTPNEEALIGVATLTGEFSQAELRDGKQYEVYCKWYRDNRPDYTAQDWASEYDCDFVQSGLAVFKEDDVEAIFRPELAFEAPLSGERYVTWWDIGRRRDATVGTTYRLLREAGTGLLKKRIVAWERFEGLPYPQIARKIEERATRYVGDHYVESNSPGDPLIEMMAIRVEGQFTSARSKSDMLTALVLDIENRVLESPPIKQLRAELLMYQWDDTRLIQDAVISLAGASYNSGKPGSTLAVMDTTNRLTGNDSSARGPASMFEKLRTIALEREQQQPPQ